MKTRNYFTAKFNIAILFALACFFQESKGHAAGLFIDASAADVKAAAPATVDSDIFKHRIARVNLNELAIKKHSGARLEINLFNDLSFEGTVDQLEQRSVKNYTVSGHLGDDNDSKFTLSVIEDVAAMNVRTSEGKFYRVRFTQNGLHEICEVNPTKFPDCGVKAEHAIALPPVDADQLPQTQGDAGNIIDVMVVYTPAARIAAGGSNAITSLINLAVSESNTAYQESQINTRIRLVYASEVAYTEAGFNTDLARLKNSGDTFLEEVQTLRNTYGADLVSLWINDASSCGLAYVMPSLSSSYEEIGFSVVHWDCATGYYSFAHEMAHNMGCQHDRETAGSQGLYSYSYGWRFNGTNGVRYRTIMGYDDQAAPGIIRIQRFSNPNVSYRGTPTGVAIGNTNEAHNAQTINNSAFTVANFRQTVVITNISPSITAQPQPQSVLIGSNAAFSVTASGAPPLYYFWKRSNTNISGANSSTFTITNVQVSDATNYSVIVSNALGFSTSSNAALTIGITIAGAVDNTGFNWSSVGDALWGGQITNSHDEIDAAQSGTITHDQETILKTTVVGPGTLSFWWKVSSELHPVEEVYDYLACYLNYSNLVDYISGDENWTFRSFSIPAGTNLVEWLYSKDYDDINPIGADRGWVDQVSYIAASSFASNSFGKTNGQFKFVFNGLAGASYTIQTSTNLTNWAALTNLLISTPTNLFIDAGSTNLTPRFYRIKSP